MLFDTDILIWYLRGNLKAVRWIDAEKAVRISAVTYMELIKGCRSLKEQRSVSSFLSDLEIFHVPVSESVSSRACYIMEEYSRKTEFGIADALIAATAIEHGLVLATGNTKHFKAIHGLEIKSFRP